MLGFRARGKPMFRRSWLLGLVLSPFVSPSLLAQTATPNTLTTPDTANPITTIHVDAPTVIVDVVVTDFKGKPVTSLHKEDFRILEDGKPQDIRSFEAHAAATPATNGALSPQPAPALPPNTFTNAPLVPPTDAVNVLLMDALNTPMQDQVYVHKEVVKYLASIPPGTRLAVFLLSNRLRIVQGFTSDSEVLHAAIAKSSSNPTMSALLPSVAETALHKDSSRRDQVRTGRRRSKLLRPSPSGFSKPAGQLPEG